MKAKHTKVICMMLAKTQSGMAAWSSVTENFTPVFSTQPFPFHEVGQLDTFHIHFADTVLLGPKKPKKV